MLYCNYLNLIIKISQNWRLLRVILYKFCLIFGPTSNSPHDPLIPKICLGGEGLFAKKDLEAGDIVALYNGIKV